MEASTKTFYRYFPVAKRDRDWGFYVTTVGASQIKPNSCYPPSGHPGGYSFAPTAGRSLSEYQIIYISAGTGWFSADGIDEHKIEAGSVILLFPGVHHSYAPSSETGWNEHWVGFSGEWSRRLIQRGFFTAKQPVLHLGQEGDLMFLFTELVERVHANPHALQQVMAGIASRILAEVYSVQQAGPLHDDRASRIIHTAISRMRGDTKPDIEILASELGVSYRWFRAAFAKHTGMSPYKYVTENCLARARDLLMHTSLSTKEVAHSIGFEDPAYFSRLFRKKVGLTPGEWRKHVIDAQTETNATKHRVASDEN